MSEHAVTIRHNFETAHRLPHLGGKCSNLHGHSWWAEVTLSGDLTLDGTVIDFGQAKAALRGWVDTHLDHGAMLSADDMLVPAFQDDGSKLFRFGASNPLGAEVYAADLPYPTVELVAELLSRVAIVTVADRPGLLVTQVRVTETHVNAATWTMP